MPRETKAFGKFDRKKRIDGKAAPSNTHSENSRSGK
jgi:hypothetical protein